MFDFDRIPRITFPLLGAALLFFAFGFAVHSLNNLKEFSLQTHGGSAPDFSIQLRGGAPKQTQHRGYKGKRQKSAKRKPGVSQLGNHLYNR